MNRMIIRAARAQIREAQAEAEANGEDLGIGRRSKKSNREYDWDEMRKHLDARKELKDSSDNLRDVRRNRRNEKRRREDESGKMDMVWSFEPGELVMIKPSAARQHKYYLDRLGITAGSVGVIVEPEDCQHYRQSGRELFVMGPMGLQQWSAGWVTRVEEDED